MAELGSALKNTLGQRRLCKSEAMLKKSSPSGKRKKLSIMALLRDKLMISTYLHHVIKKPNCPYPRKGYLSSETPTGEVPNDKATKSNISLSNSNAETASNGTLQKLQRMELSENGSCSEVLNLFQEAPSASFSSVSKRPSNHGASKEIEPTKKKSKIWQLGKGILYTLMWRRM